MKKGTLYLIPSVIAENKTETIPDQVKEVLSGLSYFMAENVRTTRRYISSLKLGVNIETLHFDELSKKTRNEQIAELMGPLDQGYDMGILSESGCPGVADPGAKAVSYAHKNSIDVIPLVGPSSIILALMASGFNGQKFRFNGYLPVDKHELPKALKELERSSTKNDQTEIFIETPYRNNQLLESIKKYCSATTKLCIAKDLTGENHLVQTRSISDWKKQSIDLHKKPTVFMLYCHS
ncbi:SAM-dependent methyltransferase [Fulvivirga sp. M361]|uniref:SAM-dependent methyltransferase n=1 Tax=Fulvivirga sp. M361 TaxID=2594266 RepID=UPI0011799979|nr:SAM-dependent methyltransferase [Fulvivirga sp. M361]TRX62786.1 SAM-dependent methyltransferase [Fulvivirga sp. M361]